MHIRQDTLRKVVALIEDKKGQNITVLNLSEISVVTDYFLIVTGNSKIQTKAIAENLTEKLPEMSVPVLRTEGMQEANWILIDSGDLVIHVMTPETREFYSLERLWGDAEQVSL